MGREIRRVPPDWEHPRFTDYTARRKDEIGRFVPLYDDDFESAADRWEENFALWKAGKHPDQSKKDKREGTRFWEYDAPPDRENHRERKWTKAEATHFQVYETVSEGTPVTPHFATEKKLVDYLVEHGDYWDQDSRYGSGKGWSRKAAEELVRRGDAPSMVLMQDERGTRILEPRDGGLPG